jgi:hypothetical protein
MDHRRWSARKQETRAASAGDGRTAKRTSPAKSSPDDTPAITHAIRMAAYNAETALARALDGHYARAGDKACALIREALTTSGDILLGPGVLRIRLDPLTAPRRTQALAALCDQLNQAQARYPGTDLGLRYEVKSDPGIA